MYTPITEKQIQQLKSGDSLLIHGTFRRIFSDGDIGIEVKETNIHTGEPRNYLISAHPTCVSLPSDPPTSVGSRPKHDTNRLFRKGDIVEIDTHGRDIAASMKKSGLELGKRYIVTEDESNTGYNIGYVSFICDDGIEHQSMFFWLKLVTPVEELEPYSVETCQYGYTVNKGELILATYNDETHPHAKEAAEAERDRLNAEYRKEQS